MNTVARMFALDLRSIALFRIGVAAMLLLDCITRAVDVRDFWSDAGVFPRALWFKTAPVDLWSFHVATGSTIGALVLLAIGAALALCLLVGFRARAAAIASLVLLVSLHNRNLQVFYGFDLLLRVSLMWLCFLPSSARWSLDERARGVKVDGTVFPAGAQHVSAGTIAITLQMIAVYVFSGIQKLQDESWRSLDALWLNLTTDHHATAAARWLAGFYDATRALSVAILVFELLLPLLLLLPLHGAARDRMRVVVPVAFMLFHVVTGVLFELGLFPLMGVVAWLVFLPARVWDRAAPDTREVTWGKRRAAAAGAGALFVVILATNIESATRPFLPPTLKRITNIARIDQNWNMFERAMTDGWFIVRGTRGDGVEIDLLRGGAPVSLEKPASVAATFSSMRWRKYMTGLVRPTNMRHRVPFLNWMCGRWRQGTGERLVSVELVMMQETEHPKRPSITTMRPVAAVRCR